MFVWNLGFGVWSLVGVELILLRILMVGCIGRILTRYFGDGSRVMYLPRSSQWLPYLPTREIRIYEQSK
jgi:hypothetical protein